MAQQPVILITGATGFIGRYLLPEIIKRYSHVYCLVRKTSNLDNLKKFDVQLRYGDLTDKGSLQRSLEDIDIVIHLAALMSDKDYLPYSEFFKVNIEGTRNLAEISQEKIKQFIYISTVGIYGATSRNGVNERENFGCDLSKYELSKAEAEKVILSLGSQGKLPFTILRLGQLYGPYMDYGWPAILKKIEEGKMFVVGKADTLLQLTYIDDAVKGIICSLDNHRCLGKIFNICADKAYPVKEIFYEIARQLNKPAPKHLPLSLVYIIAAILQLIPYKLKPGSLKYLDLNRIKFFSANHVYSNKEARDTIGFLPGVDLETGISRMVKWYCEHKKLGRNNG